MAGWKEILVDVLKLTDTVKELNKKIEKVESVMTDVDKRVVRLETMVEIAQNRIK
jgi:peptidoglycan hydrolase CwlO-like protein